MALTLETPNLLTHFCTQLHAAIVNKLGERLESVRRK